MRVQVAGLLEEAVCADQGSTGRVRVATVWSGTVQTRGRQLLGLADDGVRRGVAFAPCLKAILVYDGLEEVVEGVVPVIVQDPEPRLLVLGPSLVLGHLRTLRLGGELGGGRHAS